MTLEFSNTVSEGALDDLTLFIGADAFPFSDATFTMAENSFTWGSLDSSDNPFVSGATLRLMIGEDTVWVTNDSVSPDNKLFAYKHSDGTRVATKDFDTLNGANNQNPRGIWSDGTTMYVVDDEDGMIYAYQMSDKSRDSGKDITLDSNNADPGGIWGNSTTIWVVNDRFSPNNKLYAYSRSSRSYDSGNDFSTLDQQGVDDNDNPRGIWSDGTTMWVVDDEDQHVYAYRMSDKSRDPARDFPLQSDNADPEGAWSNGATLFVVDDSDDKVYPYPLPHPATGSITVAGTPEAGETLTASVSDIEDDNGIPEDVVYSYQWVRNDGDDKTDIDGATETTYTLTATDLGQQISVRVSFTDAAGFMESLTSDATGAVAPNSSPNNTATGQPVITGALTPGQVLTAETSGISDADGIAHDLGFTYQWISRDGDTGTETNIPGATESVYWVPPASIGKQFLVQVSFLDSLGRPESVTSEPSAAVDFGGPEMPATGRPAIAGTPWVSGKLTANPGNIMDDNGISEDANFSYQWLRSDGGDFTEVKGANHTNYTPTVADVGRRFKVRAGFLDQDGYPESATSEPTGIVTVYRDLLDLRYVSKGWGISANDDTVWLSGVTGERPQGTVQGGGVAGLLSFDRRTGARTSHQHDELRLRALWSDGETVFAVDLDTGSFNGRPRVLAFNASNGHRDSSKDFNLSQGHYVQVKGIWGNNETIWVANNGSFADDKLFAYDRSTGARDPSKDFDTLQDAGNIGPEGIWSDGETMYVVDWSKLKVFAYRMSDKSRRPDRDIDLFEDHRNPAGVWGDGETLYVMDAGAELHAYDLTPGAVQEPPPPKKERRGWIRYLQRDNRAATGIWGNDETLWVADDDSDRVFAYDYAIRTNPRAYQNFLHNLLIGAGNNNPRDLWSDGETVFVVDRSDKKLYAYRMSDCMLCLGDHTVASRNITLDGANAEAEGMWGNDETIWVANDGNGAGNKLYAYRRSDGSRDSSKDFDTLNGAGNKNPRALWSDGQTMFVLDQEDARVYAYSMDDKSHDADKGVAFLGISFAEGMWFDGYRLLVVADIANYNDDTVTPGRFSEVYAFILKGVAR